MRMQADESDRPAFPDPAAADSAPGLTKREYYATHLFGPVTANLSQYATMQDKARHAVDAADALLRALAEKPAEAEAEAEEE